MNVQQKFAYKLDFTKADRYLNIHACIGLYGTITLYFLEVMTANKDGIVL